MHVTQGTLWYAWQHAGISQKANLPILTPEPTYSTWMRKSSLILSFLVYSSFWRTVFSLVLLYGVGMEIKGEKNSFFKCYFSIQISLVSAI